jgi:hypothetical protein
MDPSIIPPLVPLVDMNHSPVSTPFWYENPNILCNNKFIMEFFPTENMSYNEKLNAISRSVILLTMVGLFFSTNRIRLFMVGLVSLGMIYFLHQHHTNQESSQNIQEGLEILRPSPALDYLQKNNLNTESTVFQQPTIENPFGNVMMSDYDYNPNKLPAPPASNPMINDIITQNAKKLIQEANPGQPDIDKKLFHDLTEQLGFEQSMRQFNTNPSTTIPNDQGAFAEFCYGSMVSCKEGNLFACARNTSHYTNY